MEVPLPDLATQYRITDKRLHACCLYCGAEQNEDLANGLEEGIDKALFEKLGIDIIEEPKPKNRYSYLIFSKFSDLINRWEFNQTMRKIITTLDKGRYSYYPLSFKFQFVTRPWDKTKHGGDIFNYIEISGIDKDLGILKKMKSLFKKHLTEQRKQLKAET